MKILQLCNKMPYPEKDGGAIAINTLSHSLINAGCTVKMLAMNTIKHFIDINNVPQQLRESTGLEAVTIDTSIKPLGALIALISGKSYNVSRFYSEKFGDKLISILKADTFDVIQLEGLYLTPYIKYIRQYTKAPIVLRAHNVEWVIWEKLAQEEKSSLKKWYLTKLVKSLKEYETGTINQCDAISVFTENDKKKFLEMGCKVPVEKYPFGIDVNKYVPKQPEHRSVFFIGALDWMPNLQGLEWFLNNVWLKVYTSFPAIKFHIAGRNMPETLKTINLPNLVFHGEVENAISYMQEYGVQVIPLFAGSGIRVKIIEGMALGKTIATTTQGVEGIECKYGEDILVADTPEAFYQAVKKCLDDKAYSQRIADNARKFIEKAHNINIITGGLLDFYKQLISKKQQ